MRVALLLFAALLAVLPVRSAKAHASLIETYPADQTAVGAAPPQILLTFNEQVTPIVVRVLDARGSELAGIGANVVDQELRIDFPQDAPAGSYIVTYRVTSADGHPVGGAFVFAVGPPPQTWQAVPEVAAHEDAWRWAAILDRLFVFVGSLVASGGVLFLLLFHATEPEAWRALRRVNASLASLALSALFVGIFIEGGLLLDAPFDLSDPFALWNQGASSSVGPASLVGGIGLIAILLGRRVLSGLGMALVVVSFALSGHAATASPRWLAIPTLLFHVSLAMFWIGSFVPLLKTLGRSEPVAAVHRFSQLAVILVPQLLIAGAILGLLQVESLPALFDTDYGLGLFRKVVLVAILLGVAAFNRLVLTPRLASGHPRAAQHLRLAIGGELLLGLAILFWTAYLSETVPPRSLAGHNHGSTALSRLSGAYNVAETATGERALVQVNPGRSGWNTLNVHLLDKNGQEMNPKEVAAELSQPALGIEPIRRPLSGQGNGYFEHSGVDFAAPGEWSVRIDALVSDFDQLTFETRITIR